MGEDVEAVFVDRRKGLLGDLRRGPGREGLEQGRQFIAVHAFRALEPRVVQLAGAEPGRARYAVLAQALRAQGQCGPWRDEQLAVCNAHGERLGTIERGAVRVLGIATRAVHLVGRAPDGRIWVQQRSKTKPNNPGMWDTLMGGMVSAADTLQQALERETWEEAGLRLPALHGVARGGQVDFSRPSREGGGVGYMVERIDWFRCTVPEGLEPRNQDGEVERFELWSPAQVRECIAAGGFTLEAALVLGACCGL